MLKCNLTQKSANAISTHVSIVNFARSHVRVAAALGVGLVVSLVLTRLTLLKIIW